MQSTERTGISASPARAAGPLIGIFWGVRDGAGIETLLVDQSPLGEAEAYGDFLTHPRGHHEVWETWRKDGPAVLVRNGLPALVAWHEYEEWPRGRIVFEPGRSLFTVYADRRLQTQAWLDRIFWQFDLTGQTCVVRSDPHYRAR